MFTIDQIKAAHSKVKSGADFPIYVQDLIKLGLVKYDSFVTDGHAVYFGENGFSIQSGARYSPLVIAVPGNAALLEQALASHQLGKTDYPTFCKQSANAGVEKWTVDAKKLTCTYYDEAENELVSEQIPTS